MNTEQNEAEYDFDTSTSEAGGEFDPSRYDGQGSGDLEETGVTHEPEELSDEELDEAEATLDEDDEPGEDDA